MCEPTLREKIDMTLERKTPECVRPSEEYMLKVLNGSAQAVRLIRQYINWAACYLGLKDRYSTGNRITVRSMWILYEACRQYLESKAKEENND